MLDKSFIEKIEEMAKNELVMIDGVQYSTRKLNQVRKPMAAQLEVNTLSSIVQFIENTLSQKKVTYPLMVNVKYNRIDVHSSLDENLERDLLLTSLPLTPRLDLGVWLPVEDFIVRLQTCFIETPNRIALAKLASNFMSVNSLELKDNGFGQEAVITSGIALQEKIEIQPIIKLKPIRTFNEVEQVESMFLFRINKSGQMCLFEADGGVWKTSAQKIIVEKLTEDLKVLINDRNVVIVG